MGNMMMMMMMIVTFHIFTHHQAPVFWPQPACGAISPAHHEHNHLENSSPVIILSHHVAYTQPVNATAVHTHGGYMRLFGNFLIQQQQTGIAAMHISAEMLNI
jgi:hypothetical protein